MANEGTRMAQTFGGQRIGGGKVHGLRVADNGTEYQICDGRSFSGGAVRFPVDVIDCARCRRKIEEETAYLVHGTRPEGK